MLEENRECMYVYGNRRSGTKYIKSLTNVYINAFFSLIKKTLEL